MPSTPGLSQMRITLVTQNVVPRPAALVSPENLIKMQNFRSLIRLFKLESEI